MHFGGNQIISYCVAPFPIPYRPLVYIDFTVASVFVAHATCLTESDRGPRNSLGQWARCTPVVGLSLEHPTVMEQRNHLVDFLRGRIIGRLECGRTQLEVSEELRIAQSVISRLWQRFQDYSNASRCYSTGHPRVTTPNEDRYLLPKETDGAQHQNCLVSSLQQPRVPATRYHQENTIKRHRYSGEGWLVWGGIILRSRTDLHVQSVTMTGHIYRDVILEQHVRLFRVPWVLNFCLWMTTPILRVQTL
ncbi:HTH_Tnp_Tc3_2 domain-containing protein [Trichonephila clavipes]|nr:HTH_Tnp_Tc3_2 domain-containing protein [Trichonephila clavipes]